MRCLTRIWKILKINTDSPLPVYDTDLPTTAPPQTSDVCTETPGSNPHTSKEEVNPM
jgi:hypothetical protein